MVAEPNIIYDLIISAIHQGLGNEKEVAERICYSLSKINQNEFFKFKRVWKRKIRSHRSEDDNTIEK